MQVQVQVPGRAQARVQAKVPVRVQVRGMAQETVQDWEPEPERARVPGSAHCRSAGSG